MQDGFTLIEMVLVLGLIGILTTLGSPGVMSSIAHARRAESKLNLSHLGSLQEIYRVENGEYYDGKDDLDQANKYGTSQCTHNELGFYVNDCKNAMRYKYWIDKEDDGFVALAQAKHDTIQTRIYPFCTLSTAVSGGSITYGGGTHTPAKLLGDVVNSTDQKAAELYIDAVKECRK